MIVYTIDFSNYLEFEIQVVVFLQYREMLKFLNVSNHKYATSMIRTD